jgi:RNA polymerase sigma-70 factor (ECF subfamily)
MQALADRMGETEPAMRDLLEEAQRGNVAAFETIYRRHAGRVFAVCRRLAGDEGRAEELTQEAFLRAWRHLGSCPGGEALAGWLCRLAIHVVLSDNRKTRRRSRRETLSQDGKMPERGGSQGSPALAMDLERAIDRLPPGARQVFVLHDVEGFRHEEIGKLLGLSPGTSKAQLHRARRLLKEALES